MAIARLSLPADQVTVAGLREIVDGAACRSDLVRNLSFRTLFVLEELCLNIRDYGVVPGRTIDLTLSDVCSTLVIDVVDTGVSFNPLVDPAPPVLSGPLRDRPPGGLGIHLVRSIADSVSYRRVDGCNAVRVELRPC